MAFTFGEIKNYLARDMRLSVRMLKGGDKDYLMVSDLPDGKYDDLIVYNLAEIKFIEFPEFGEYVPASSPELSWMSNKPGIGFEITLCEQIPDYDDRDHTRTNGEQIVFRDLRNLLPMYGHCSVGIIGEGKEAFRSSRDIPESYNGKYLFGLGMEPDKTDITAGTYEYRYVVLLANRPRT